MTSLIDRHANKISGVISCFDRVVISGTIPGICHSQGMTDYLYYLGVRIFDYTKWAAPLREEVRDHAARVAKDNGLEIQHVRTNKLSKESIVAKIVKERGEHPGPVHILSAMERRPSLAPWHDKRTHIDRLHGFLDRQARKWRPVIRHFHHDYHLGSSRKWVEPTRTT